ncbi:PTS system mannose/fructose/N-acetylgalactosamine-transporter subunit IIB [Lacticaseibacillus paracasei]|uniref:PTS sugar transporter subunit IIB n=1 Tax=Lacticaseibacillus paracasei TaxID=1597 RepID=A0ABD5CZW3_LACPA|nr:PTS sugar transporter subunit IIB [Lacticaseibacillus paracasei]EPC96477.1 PTS system sorbose subfamily transporter subunit IIB [Lacticaseibacillus paracasei subsp. paracasei CNCM I-4649]MDE3289541.1 PTS sugar transporter subunit IIB [Lacticaseibacillus paracasei]MDR7625468.1 PTS sugar transporter subunit IIB [Lacticaseibacillus paracasei]QPC12933.1 PTS sugar transporter subunit IIB [Lacticaseibacillus paracasei subsp. tolerans]QUS98219.1 PTS sugar transporter subunit IIB [Lacticaseibacillu
MKNIVWARIDDRLIHGQVMTSWVQYTKGNEIEIVDNEVAEDDFLKMVTTSTAPENVLVRVDNQNDAANYLKGVDDGQRLIVLAKTPDVFLRLIENGVEIKHINLGGMGAKAGRSTLYRNISASADERDTFRELMDKDVKIGIQIIAQDKEVDLSKIL